jgi:hypothetical protein
MSVLVYITPLILALLIQRKDNRFIDVSFFLVIGFLVLIRYGVGYDYFNYFAIESSGFFPFAPIANWLLDIVRKFNFPNGFVGISAFITFCILAYTATRPAKERKLSPFLFICLPFYFIEAFSLSRQMLAISFVILGYSFTLSGEDKKATLLYILAVGIHITSIVFLPLLLLWKNYKPKHLPYLCVGIVILGFIFKSISSQDVLGRALFYLSEDNSGGLFYIVITLLTLIYVAICDKKLFGVTLIGFLYALFVFQFLTYPFNRLLAYFFIPVLFCKINKPQSTNDIIGKVALVMTFFITLHIKIRDEGNNFIPFNTIFNVY